MTGFWTPKHRTWAQFNNRARWARPWWRRWLPW
jgi:hypothetical protein